VPDVAANAPFKVELATRCRLKATAAGEVRAFLDGTPQIQQLVIARDLLR
jgi:hypothetical protein